MKGEVGKGRGRRGENLKVEKGFGKGKGNRRKGEEAQRKKWMRGRWADERAKEVEVKKKREVGEGWKSGERKGKWREHTRGRRRKVKERAEREKRDERRGRGSQRDGGVSGGRKGKWKGEDIGLKVGEKE